jgi:hypothetical protein
MVRQTMGELENQDEEIEGKKILLLYAILRKRENPGVTKPRVIRQVMRVDKNLSPFTNNILEYKEDIEIIKSRLKERGVWRIYETVNARNPVLSQKELMIRLIKNEKDYSLNIDSLWKTCLMQPENKAERFFLIDIDTKDENIIKAIELLLEERHINYLLRETVRGYHIKSDVFDIRLITNDPFYKDVEIKKDALFFIQTIEIQ